MDSAGRISVTTEAIPSGSASATMCAAWTSARLAQRAYKHSDPVRARHRVELGSLLVQATPGVSCRVFAHVRAREQAVGLHVLHRPPWLEQDDAAPRSSTVWNISATTRLLSYGASALKYASSV